MKHFSYTKVQCDQRFKINFERKYIPVSNQMYFHQVAFQSVQHYVELYSIIFYPLIPIIRFQSQRYRIRNLIHISKTPTKQNPCRVDRHLHCMLSEDSTFYILEVREHTRFCKNFLEGKILHPLGTWLFLPHQIFIYSCFSQSHFRFAPSLCHWK